jgi:hypothetical protein
VHILRIDLAVEDAGDQLILPRLAEFAVDRRARFDLDAGDMGKGRRGEGWARMVAEARRVRIIFFP